MPDEKLITQFEDLFNRVTRLGGSQERTHMVPNLTVQTADPGGLDGFMIVSDNRDGDNIIAKKVPAVTYADNDLVNVMFIEGGEAIAFQQGSESPSTGTLWQKVPSTSTDIYYNDGDVGIGKAVAPDAALEVLSTSQAQLRLTHTEDSKFVNFTLDTNHDLTVKPSSTGQIILQPTVDSTDFFQVLDADGGTPIINADSTNERLGIATTLPAAKLEIETPTATEIGLIVQTIDDDGTNPQVRFFDSADAGIFDIKIDDSTNVFLGFEAGLNNTPTGVGGDGQNNIFIGSQAGKANTTGQHNFALGFSSMLSNTTGERNVSIGYFSMANSSDMDFNVAIGYESMRKGTTADFNVAIGYRASAEGTNTARNVAIGHQAGANNISGDANVFIGYLAGRTSAAASYDPAFNIAIGQEAGRDLQDSDRNVLIGYRSGFKLSTGEFNTFLGYNTGFNLTSGDANVLIGYTAGQNLTTESNLLYIANTTTSTPLIYGEFNNDLLKFYADNADTNVVHDVVDLVHNSSGTPVANFGVGLKFQLESSTTATQNAARISALWTTATHATRASALTFETLTNAGALTEQMRIAGNGVITSVSGRIKNTTRIDDGDSPYTVLATDEIIVADTDGGVITVNLPAGVDGTHYRITNVGTAANDVTVDPNGTEQLFGGGAGVSFALVDGETINIYYETTEGWW